MTCQNILNSQQRNGHLPWQDMASEAKEVHSNPHTHQPSSGLAVQLLKPSLTPSFPWRSVMLQKPDHHWLKSSAIWCCSSHLIQSRVRQRSYEIWGLNMQELSVWEQSYPRLVHLKHCIFLSEPKVSESSFVHHFLWSVIYK